jgi:heme/copper-type cytochrome/quinol oxidase subunit 4
MVVYLQLVMLFHMNWFKRYEIYEAILTFFIIFVLFVIGVMVYKIRKAVGMNKK